MIKSVFKTMKKFGLTSKKVKQLFKEFGFYAGVLNGSLAEGRLKP